MKVRTLTEGRPLPMILSLAMPLMLGNLFQQLYTVVDAQIVGGVEGVGALASIGVSDWFSFLFFSLIQGLAQGFTVPMAQAFGAGNHKHLRRCIGNAITLCIFMAVLLTGTALLLIHPVLVLLDTPAEVFPTAASYLRVLFAALPIVVAYNLMAGILRSLGDSHSPLWAMVVAAVANIGLDLLFVAGFRWGVLGAAAATAMAQALSCLYCVVRLFKVPFARPHKEDLRLHRNTALHLIALGIPIAGQNAIIALGGMLVQRIVNAMSVAFIAGYTATNKLYGVLETAAISYGYAVSTYAGQNLGAQKIPRIRKGVWQAALAGIMTALLIAAVMFFFGEGMVSGFISGTPEETAEATSVACQYLYLLSAWLPTLYILNNYRSALQGLGNGFLPLLSGLVELVMRLAAVALLPAYIGHAGLFWAEILAWLGGDVVLLPAYFHIIRKLHREQTFLDSIKNKELA